MKMEVSLCHQFDNNHAVQSGYNPSKSTHPQSRCWRMCAWHFVGTQVYLYSLYVMANAYTPWSFGNVLLGCLIGISIGGACILLVRLLSIIGTNFGVGRFPSFNFMQAHIHASLRNQRRLRVHPLHSNLHLKNRKRTMGHF